MTIRTSHVLLLAGLLLLMAGCRSSHTADTADQYAVRMNVNPAPGAALQRIPLPPVVYTASRRGDLGDVRIFDVSGRSLPAALVDDRDLLRAKERTFGVPVHPIVGPANALRLSGVSLHLNDSKEARIVGATGIVTDEADSTIGALLDTRGFADPATALTLDADIPQQRPVAFNLESSQDLKTWQPLAEKVFFRSGSTSQLLGSGTIPLSSVNLAKQYVRVTWSGAPASSVRLKSAQLTTSPTPPVQRVDLPTTRAMLVSPHDVRFSLSFGTKLDAVRITPAAQDTVIPVQVFGRNTPEQPWQPLAAGVLYGGGVTDRDKTRNLVELGGVSWKTYKLEADARTAGFSSVPGLNLLFRPANLVVMFNGSGPFTLAAGSPRVSNVFLDAKEIAGAQSTDLARLPVASVSSTRPSLVGLAPTELEGRSKRRMILWAALALGTAVLLFATFTLFRKASPLEISQAGE